MALPAPDALPNKGHDLGGAGVNEDEIYVRYNRLHFTLKKDETVIIDYSQAITTEIDVDAVRIYKWVEGTVRLHGYHLYKLHYSHAS